MIVLGVVLVTFILMEGVSWAMHKYVMHGAFWYLHEDHHTKHHHKGFFELNDWFFVFFAVLSMAFYGTWSFTGNTICLGIGIGITVYGLAYFIIHDLFIHQRIKIWRNTKNPYLLAIRRAHKMHHKHLGKHYGECFGMLWVPLKYYKQYFT